MSRGGRWCWTAFWISSWMRAPRSWFARPDSTPPTGYRALAGPEIGQVLRSLHEGPARPWTVASLAHEAGMSRTAFARRFSALVGRPPLTCLTECPGPI
ncbi:AraC family transcriptional regulator [Streptomyces sp. LX-29]|uniref:AraC family transcriptional regulator n=1 Tax=Streptomyces sp. LX-29 TaxID=2900152 RepID=UPI00240DF32D|nr:AraC family transcriptional regulator [Streptomyces sp. LX-29]WFB05624.1 AraC family transcriptional regulator [Streptomyces sp. LX-29]